MGVEKMTQIEFKVVSQERIPCGSFSTPSTMPLVNGGKPNIVLVAFSPALCILVSFSLDQRKTFRILQLQKLPLFKRFLKVFIDSQCHGKLVQEGISPNLLHIVGNELSHKFPSMSTVQRSKPLHFSSCFCFLSLFVLFYLSFYSTKQAK